MRLPSSLEKTHELALTGQGNITEPATGRPWFARGRYYVSPLNYAEDVQRLYAFPPKMRVHEGTLRKLEHASGVRQYSTTEKVDIARLLAEVGVEEIGMNPGQFAETIKGEAALEGLRAICNAGLNMKVRAADHDMRWLDGDLSYLDTLADCGVNGIELIVGTQATELVWGTSHASIEKAERSVTVALEHIRRRGLDAGVMLADIGRTDLDEALRLMNVWLDHGAERFHLVDSHGALSPDATRHIVHLIRSRLKRDVPLPYHVHDGFGLAVACALAAASAGAWPETAVNGFGDRGFTRFEEVVLSLELLYGVSTGIRLERLSELSAAVEQMTRSQNHPNKPITGAAIWAPQTTRQYQAFLKGQDALSTYMSAFNPELVGARLEMRWSANTLSEAAIETKLASMGLPHAKADVAGVLAAVRTKLLGLDVFPMWLTEAEIDEICRRQVA